MITARIQYGTGCHECGEYIVKGDTVVQGDGYVAHVYCSPDSGGHRVTTRGGRGCERCGRGPAEEIPNHGFSEWLCEGCYCADNAAE